MAIFLIGAVLGEMLKKLTRRIRTYWYYARIASELPHLDRVQAEVMQERYGATSGLQLSHLSLRVRLEHNCGSIAALRDVTKCPYCQKGV
jgi:hypothetical protein